MYTVLAFNVLHWRGEHLRLKSKQSIAKQQQMLTLIVIVKMTSIHIIDWFLWFYFDRFCINILEFIDYFAHFWLVSGEFLASTKSYTKIGWLYFDDLLAVFWQEKRNYDVNVDTVFSTAFSVSPCKITLNPHIHQLKMTQLTNVIWLQK